MSLETGTITVAVADEGEDPAPVAGSTVGYIDVVEQRRIAGWAWCRRQPEMQVDVEIRLDDQIVGRARADRLRSDLARGGVGDGRHAFEVVLDEPLAAEQKARIAGFAVCPDGTRVPLVNRTVKTSVKTRAEGAAQASEVSQVQPVLDAVAGLQKAMEDRSSALATEVRSTGGSHAAATGAVQEKLEDVRVALEALGRQLSAVEVFQARLDAAVATIVSRSDAVGAGRKADRGLIMAVAALSLVSCASLVLGLISVF